jgi:hypothetical protein
MPLRGLVRLGWGVAAHRFAFSYQHFPVRVRLRHKGLKVDHVAGQPVDGFLKRFAGGGVGVHVAGATHHDVVPIGHLIVLLFTICGGHAEAQLADLPGPVS